MAHSSRPADVGAPPARIQGIEMPFYSFLCINKLRPMFGRVGPGLPVVMYTYDMVDQLLMYLHPKSHNLSEHPHVLCKQRHESSLLPLLPSRLK